MPQGKIIADTAKLNSTAKEVRGLAQDYETEYNNLFKLVQSLKSAWEGKDNVAFTERIEGFRDDFQRMKKLMDDYAAYIEKVATTYQTTQSDLVSGAKLLSQGN